MPTHPAMIADATTSHDSPALPMTNSGSPVSSVGQVCREHRDGDLRAVTSSAGVGVHDLKGLGPAGQPVVVTGSASRTVARIAHADMLFSASSGTRSRYARAAFTWLANAEGGYSTSRGHPAAHNRPHGRKLRGPRSYWAHNRPYGRNLHGFRP